MQIEKELIEKLKQRADFVDLVRQDEESGAGQAGVLRRHENHWRSGHYACHTSSSQGFNGNSLWVDPSEGGWYCHECGTGGDVFDWLEQHRQMNFLEAATFLAEETNTELPTISAEQLAEARDRKAERDEIQEVMKAVFSFYHRQMGQEHRDYYKQRGISTGYIDRYLLGYASSAKGQARKAMKQLGYTDQQLLATGLFTSGKYGPVERYSDRYIIPYWQLGQTVYSIARLSETELEKRPEWDRGKYIKHLTHNRDENVSEHAVSHILFGLDSVRLSDDIVVAEGVIDAILALDKGLSCLSPVTNNFRQEDWQQLADLTQGKQVYLIFDNEESQAGLKGALKAAEYLFQQDRIVNIVQLPIPEGAEKADLADYLNRHSVEELKQLMAESDDYLSFQIRQLASIGGSQAMRQLPELIEKMSHLEPHQLDFYADQAGKYKLVGKRTFAKMVKDLKAAKVKAAKAEQAEQMEQELPASELVRWKIENLREDKTRPDHQTKQAVSDLVKQDFQQGGQFYHTQEQSSFWFDQSQKRLYALPSTEIGPLIADRYGLNQTEIIYSFVVTALQNESLLRGQETVIHRFSYYDQEQGLLYVFNNKDKVYRLNGESIELVDNGTDGILFLANPMQDEFTYQPGADPDLVSRLIVDPINFSDTGGHLTVDDQRAAFSVWLASLFFESLLPTKPIQFFLGEKGSGKTTRQRMVGRWLYGQKFDVTPILAQKEDAFVTTVINESFVAFDNVDSTVPWLPDRLAQCSTGNRIVLRRLYTDAEQEVFYPRCFLSLNSRTPNFKRDDVADRMLIFSLKRVEDFRAEGLLMQEIMDQRDQLWSSMLDSLNQVVAHLQQDQRELTAFFRMADWASLGWKIYTAWTGDGQYFLDLLQKLDDDQKEFLMTDDPFVELLEIWVGQNAGVKVTSTEMMGQMASIAEEMGVTLGFRSAVAFGRHLSNNLTSLRRKFDIEVSQRSRRFYYVFYSLEDG